MTLPSVVAIGGGHGLAATLRALRLMPVNPTAVVAVADDGGSSGRLRADSDRAAPGDLRKCLVALAADPDDPLTRAMAHRFTHGELDGHSLGNLLISAVQETEGGLVAAMAAVSEMLGAVGTVLPSTSDPVDLVAELVDGSEVTGQVAIAATSGIRSVRVQPAPEPCAEALDAIGRAEVIVLGPGSLFTSVLASVVVPGIAEAINASEALVVFVCNLRPQAHETDGFDVSDHVSALVRHGVTPDAVIHDPKRIGPADAVVGAIAAPLADTTGLAHDPALLASALGDLMAGASIG